MKFNKSTMLFSAVALCSVGNLHNITGTGLEHQCSFLTPSILFDRKCKIRECQQNEDPDKWFEEIKPKLIEEFIQLFKSTEKRLEIIKTMITSGNSIPPVIYHTEREIYDITEREIYDITEREIYDIHEFLKTPKTIEKSMQIYALQTTQNELGRFIMMKTMKSFHFLIATSSDAACYFKIDKETWQDHYNWTYKKIDEVCIDSLYKI
ncbi:hypothetical protein ACFLY6_00715 [Candidatus Dependentiae bacterium]